MKTQLHYFRNGVKRHLAYLIILYLVSGFMISIYGTNHYVAKNAGGSNDGSSWSNAWESFSVINWSVVQPGDVIYISGGSDSTVYTETMTIGKNGTSTNKIIITKGIDAGHNGKVVIYGVSNGFNISNSYISISKISFKACGRAFNISSGANVVYIDSCTVSKGTGQGTLAYMSGSTGNVSSIDSIFIRYNHAVSDSQIASQPDIIYAQRGIGNIYILHNVLEQRDLAGTSHIDCIQTYNAADDVGNIYICWNKLLNLKDVNSQGLMGNTSSSGYKTVLFCNVVYTEGTGNILWTYVSGPGYGDSYFINNTAYTHNSTGKVPLFPQGSHIYNYNNIAVNDYWYAEAFDTESLNILSDHNLFYTSNNNYTVTIGSGLTQYGHTLSYWQNQSQALYGTGQDIHSMVADPLFTSMNNEYAGLTLQDGSPAKNAGMDVQSIVEGLGLPYVGINGSPMSITPDMGANGLAVAGGGENNPPNTPTSPNPINGAVNQPTGLTVTWSCSDPDGDPLTYDVYFGSSSNPALVSGNQTNASYNPGQLDSSATYYWKIVAKDNQGASTSGPVWSFTTVAAGGDTTPPEVVNAFLTDSVTLHINFSEPLEQSGAETPDNYTITNNINVLSATLSDTEVTLITTEHQPNVSYTVTVNNVTDLAGNIILPTANTGTYQYIAAYGYTMLGIDSAYASAWYQNYVPPKAIDGITSDTDPESRWGGALPMPDSIMFDLGQDRMVGQARFSFYNWSAGRIYVYSLYASMDGENWSTVAENVSSSSSEWSVINFNLTECRYIKLISISNNQSQWAGLYEAQLWGLDITTEINQKQEIPSKFELQQNYPNPLNPATTIQFSAPIDQHIKISVYNIIGQLVQELTNKDYKEGNYSVVFNAWELPSGVYLYRMESQSFNYTRKMVLLK